MVNVLFYESSDLFCFISEGFLRAYYVPRALGMQRDGFCEAFGQWVGQGFRQACCGWGRGRGVRYMWIIIIPNSKCFPFLFAVCLLHAFSMEKIWFQRGWKLVLEEGRDLTLFTYQAQIRTQYISGHTSICGINIFWGGRRLGKKKVSRKAPYGNRNGDKLEKTVLWWSLALGQVSLLLVGPFKLHLRNFHEPADGDCCWFISFIWNKLAKWIHITGLCRLVKNSPSVEQ